MAYGSFEELEVWKRACRLALPDIDDFQEVHAMLQQRVEQWNEAIREQAGPAGYISITRHWRRRV